MDTRIEAIPTPVSATCVLPPSRKISRLLNVSEVLVASTDTISEADGETSRKASNSCSFSAVIGNNLQGVDICMQTGNDCP